MMIKEITSPQNAMFKKWIRLLSGSEVKKQNITLVTGIKQVKEVLRDNPEECLGIIGLQRKPLSIDIPPQTAVYELSAELFRKLDVFGTGPPLLLVQVKPMPAWTDQIWPVGCTLFIPFQDPSNLGAVIRTAAAFGVAQIVCLKEAAHPFNLRAVRVAGSAVFKIPLLKGPSIHELTGLGKRLFVLDRRGSEVINFKFPRIFGLLPGREGLGLPRPLFENYKKLAIPINHEIESLNAAMAVGVVLYEWRRGLAV